VIVDCALYEDGKRRSGELSLSEAAVACHAPDAFVWIGLYEPTEEEFATVGREFGFHELAIEDAVHAHQRPKLEIYGESLFVVLKTARYVDPVEVASLGEIQVFVGEGFAVVVRHGEASALGVTRKELEQRPDLLELGPSAVLYAVVDRVVDDYAPVVRQFDEAIADVEYQVFAETDVADNPVERIYKLKREVLEINAATSPLLEPLELLSQKHDLPWVPAEMRTYFRDVHDHLERVQEQVDTFRDVLTSVLEANLTRVSVRQNADMRKISAWVAIAAIPTLVGGIYGMNFEHMPELDQEWAYPAVLLLIAIACGFLYRKFRRSGWL
jgi:magnesium transporter